MPIKSLTAQKYVPTQSRTGNQPVTAFRGANLWLRGQYPNQYYEVYGGSKDLNETVPYAALTGIVSFSPASDIITGFGSDFENELHLGQMVISLFGELFIVDEIISSSLFRAGSLPLTTNQPSEVLYRMPLLFEVGKKRGVLLSGNALEFDKGNILAVGSGTLKINGANLPGESLDAEKKAKIAIYDGATGNYAVYYLGFAGSPSGITAAAVAGGTRGMSAGKYSLRAVKHNSVTGGYGNPGEKITVTLAAGEKIRLSGLTLSGDDLDDGFDSWLIFGNKYGGTTALNDQSYANGAWYLVKTILPDDVTDLDADSAEDDYDLEYLDAEIDGTLRLLTFDNDAPPDAEFIATVAGYPVLVSCLGRGTPDFPEGTSPGAMIVPTKPGNIAAAPLGAAVPLSPPETIIGFYMAAGRLYLLTPNTLQIAVFTADPTFPVATRPFWKAGFKNPHALCFVNGTLYGFTSQGAMRSVEGGDEGSEQHSFAADVEEIMNDWDGSRVFVVHDPKNECVCYIYSAAYKNSSDKWVSVCLPYMLRQEAWNMPIVFSSATRDMIISGAATVNGRLEFLAGGRFSGTLQVDTFRFDDDSAGESVPYYVAYQYADEGYENRPKKVRGVRVTGKLTSASFGVHGAAAGEVIDVAALEAGNTGSKSGAISIATGAGVTLNEWAKLNVPNLNQYTVRIEGTWAGTGARDRLDETAVDVIVQGARR